ncbi:MAG TPA: histidine triad nucleotide-binding protein [Planctomycetes bacterium]|nr:histidine triad nucleotide-binding protein [Planctomycetota bacterium]
MTETIFSKILSGETPADILFEDELAIAFRDITPQAPSHVLVIPRSPIQSIKHAGEEDCALLGHCLRVCAKVAEQEGIAEDGYRVVTNIGDHGGQTIFHLHFHVLGGRKMTWPPG